MKKRNNHIKRLTAFLCLSVAFISGALAQSRLSPVIPMPQTIQSREGVFVLSDQTPLSSDPKSNGSAARYFLAELLKYKGLALSRNVSSSRPAIKFMLQPEKRLKGALYQLDIRPEGIQVNAATEEGLFAGAVSIMQIVRNTAGKTKKLELACYSISDAPFYNWRGLMLDESRHFFGKEKVKDILDWMAFYKLNKFHWHLTDQPGWRLEIKGYPKLNLIGGIGNYSDPLAPAKYYTQDDINEIVAYAAARFIQVIPEIDMPGHATAANRAYPEFSGGGNQKYPEFTFNPGKEETFQYLNNILKEVNVLFPSRMIHIGADEVHFGNDNWNKDSAVQALMKDKQLKNLKEVENYFVHRIADSVKKMGAEVLAWDEVVASSLSPEKTTVFWWRHDKRAELMKAFDKGFKTVLCPRLPLYFDFVQDSTQKIGRKWAGNFVPIKSVYEFPDKEILEHPKSQELVRGIQANIWTESVSTEQHLDYMLFPRITALAESAWTNPVKKNYPDFELRLKRHLRLFAESGLYYFDPFEPGKYREFIGPVQRKNMTPDADELTRQEKQIK